MKVLIADDSKMWRTILKDFLSSQDHSVEIAKDGLEAYFKVYETSPDALVSDLVMPGLNGYQLCRVIKRDPKLADMPVILLTGSGDNVSRFWSIYSGADAYIEKNSSSALNSIQNILGKYEKKWKNSLPLQNGKDVFEAFLDELLTDTTLRAEIRELSNHVEDMDYTVHKIKNFLKNILSIDSLSLLIVSIDEITLYTPSKDPQKMEKIFLSYLKKPYFPNSHIYKNIDGEEDVSEVPTTLKVITFDGKEEGILALWRKKDFSSKEEKILSIICEELGGIFKNGIQLNNYRKGAYFDELTGIANFRSIEEYLEELWNTQKFFEIAIIDIDHFKNVNDTYGHKVGNEVLSGIGNLLKNFSQENGTFVGRFGGEEFIVIHEGANFLTQAMNELREKVRVSHFSKSVPTLTITISAGVASRDDSKSFTETIEFADRLLYQAKESGRNKVISYESV